MFGIATTELLDEVVRREMYCLEPGELSDYDPLIETIGERRFVLIGEASHGTHEFYRERAQLTKRLIEEKGFDAVAVEADFPDADRVNRFVCGTGNDENAVDALGGFRRFPAWMWRNADVLDFVGWLRSYNDSLPKMLPRVGFFGLDLYSLQTSIDAVIRYLNGVDPEAAAVARKRYSCFDHFDEDTQLYGYSTAFGLSRSCEDEVVEQLLEIYERAADLARSDGRIARVEYFSAAQNARLVRNAERYYRLMYRSDVSSWNLRDAHMAETLAELDQHLTAENGRPAKIVVWEHNSHLGDARATEMGRRGEWNVGQLCRERYGNNSFLIGFTTFEGTVTAADNWGEPAHRMRVRKALPESVEEVFHRSGIGRFFLHFDGASQCDSALRVPLLERAIGVIYRPETERQSHYFKARLSQQFDAVIHIDETRAVEPLERSARWAAGEAETFPSGV